MKYMVLISSLLRSFHAGCSESTRDEEGRRGRIFCTLKKPDVSSALSATCYVHSTQAAQKVPETKKVDDGVQFCTLRKPDEVYGAYQQLATFIPRRLLRKYRRRRRLTMAYILYVEET